MGWNCLANNEYRIPCLITFNFQSNLYMSKIFIIGATGHIGGAVLDLVYRKYPEIGIKILVRDDKKGKILVAKYPRVIFVLGDFTILEILTKEARAADIVINAGPDYKHDIVISAILAGLANRSPKAYYIHTSGAAKVWDSPDGSQSGTKVWDDLVEIQKLNSFPSTAIHATSDSLVFAAAKDTNVAIVSPTIVYGLSPSPLHPTPFTLPSALDSIARLNSGFTISSGANIQGYIHVLDIAKIYLSLINDALQESASNPKKWGPESYYFAVSDELSFKEYMTCFISHISKHPYSLIQKTRIKELPLSEAIEVVGRSNTTFFGVNMRVKSTRAKEVLGWVPREKMVREGLGEVLSAYFREKREGGGAVLDVYFQEKNHGGHRNVSMK
ncbi:hypothetical protein EYC80_007660 [Monilinia laxa]|uniref:Saccharopine dehydrogenase NADP binding domain-containing protein n=1 Tax=Monilinia laxa TaxID=61186 RepID=A0A5N6JWM2_MONLA|nr:hypothetical protein EYC80_007660 [Monilinia laxa]